MAEQIPERQRRILIFLEQYISENSRPPTVREIGEEVGIKSTSLVSYYLKWLEQHGLIEREPSVSRGLSLTSAAYNWLPVDEDNGNVLSVPFLGYIVASAPIPSEALSGSETVEISRALFGREARDLFALKVQGNSMIDALVRDGDTVILRKQDRVENGEMAAVWLTGDLGETTLKKVYYEGNRVRLQPANPTMDPIYVPARSVQVQGKVVMVIRQM